MKQTFLITHQLETNFKIWDGRSVGNVSMNVYAVSLHSAVIKKALGIYRELIPRTRRTTTVAFWDPPSGSKNKQNAK